MAKTVQHMGALEIHLDSVGVLPGPFRRLTGGAQTMDGIKIRPGHMLDEEVLPTPTTTENVTVAANYDLDKWHFLMPRIRAAMAQGMRARISRMFMDSRKQVFDAADLYTGILVAVRPPEYDADSDDSADIELDFAVDGTIGR